MQETGKLCMSGCENRAVKGLIQKSMEGRCRSVSVSAQTSIRWRAWGFCWLAGLVVGKDTQASDGEEKAQARTGQHLCICLCCH